MFLVVAGPINLVLGDEVTSRAPGLDVTDMGGETTAGMPYSSLVPLTNLTTLGLEEEDLGTGQGTEEDTEGTTEDAGGVLTSRILPTGKTCVGLSTCSNSEKYISPTYHSIKGTHM